MAQLFDGAYGEISVGRPRNLIIPAELSDVRFANSRLTITEVDAETTPELWNQFIASVACGYQRYNADHLKANELRKDPLVKTHHYAIVSNDNEILATCSLQLSNGKGTELTQIFGKDSTQVHESLCRTWPGGYGEVKNLTILAGIDTPRPTSKEKAILLNALLYIASSNFDKESDTSMQEQGLVAVMSPIVIGFINGCDIHPDSLDLSPNQQLVPEFIHYFQYFFGPKTFKPIDQGGLLPTQIANKIMELNGIPTLARLEHIAMHDPNHPASEDIRDWLTAATHCDPRIPEKYWLTPERLVRAFIPRSYQMNAREVALQSIMNLDSLLMQNTETVFDQIDKKTAPLAVESITNRPLFEIISLDELVSLVRTRKVPVSVIPAENDRKQAVSVRSVLHNPRYVKVHLRPANNVKGVPYYDERIILLKIPEGAQINTIDQETLRRILLVYTLSRAIPNLASTDFQPVKGVNWALQLWKFLERNDTRFSKRYNFQVAIAGQGTIGLAAIPGMLLHGFGNIRVCDLANEVMDMHNIERIMQSDLSSLAMPKLVLSRAIAQNANPFVKFEIVPHGIGSYQEALAFIGDAKIVVSALDDPQAMYWLHRAAKVKGVPLLLVTDIAGGSKVQAFPYPEAELFNGMVPNSVIRRIEQGDREAFNVFVSSLLGARNTGRGIIPFIDLIAGLPIQSLRFFANSIEKLIPNLAQDRNSAMVSGAAIESIIAEYAETGKLPVKDAIVIPHDKYIEKGPLLSRIKERIKILKRLVSGLKKPPVKSAAQRSTQSTP